MELFELVDLIDGFVVRYSRGIMVAFIWFMFMILRVCKGSGAIRDTKKETIDLISRRRRIGPAVIRVTRWRYPLTIALKEISS